MTTESKTSLLNSIPVIDIDDSGTFKYVLIEAYANDGDPSDLSSEKSRLLVRGYKRAEYHADIYEEVEETEIRKLGLDCQCLGGGRILHQPDEKYIKVYGYSMGYGKADHSKTVECLKTKYKNYRITWSDSAMDKLPTELLVRIFSYVSEDVLQNVERVSVRFSHIVVCRFWNKYLLHWAKSDFNLQRHYELDGWYKDSQQLPQYDVIRSLYFKTYRLWTDSTPKTSDVYLETYSARDFEDNKVSSIAVYRDKIFLALKNTRVESRRLPNFDNRRILKDAVPENVPGHVLQSCPMTIYAKTLAALDPVRRKLYLWDANTEISFGILDTDPFGFPYDVKINSTNVVVLSGWTILCWKIDSHCAKIRSSSFNPEVIPDFDISPDSENWLSCHSLEMNEDYVVTHASKPNNAGRSSSFIHVRRSGPDGYIGQILYPETEREFLNDGDEIDRIRLSDTSNYLAILRMDENSKMPCYSISVFDVSTGRSVFRLPSSDSIFSTVQIPVQWIGKTLFVKLVPANDESTVKLARWNPEDDNNLNVLHSIQMSSTTDLLNISLSRIVRVHHKFPDPIMTQIGGDASFQLRAMIYDFWQ